MKKAFLLSILFSTVFWACSFGQQYGNYTLYSTQNGSTTQLIDTNNAVFKSWTHGTNDKTGYSSYLMPGKILWRTVRNTTNTLQGGGITGKVQKLAWDGTILWDFTYSSSTYVLHHDICPLPNGNVLLISYDVKTPAEATQAGASNNITVWSEKIIEVKPTGTTTGDIVWEWKVWDHLVQNANPAKDNYKTSIVQNAQLLNINYSLTKDWMHMNGLDYNPVLDQVAFSSHSLNEWYVIDHSTTAAEAATHMGGNAGKGGDLLFRWGNPAAYGATGTKILKVTHDAHWIPEGVPNAGRMVGFNNQGISTSASCIDQIDLPVITDYNYQLTLGSAYQPATYTQRNACSGYSSNMGNSQQLPNGNMLICVATTGLMYEINPAGATIWSKNGGGAVPQAFRYTECYVNSDVMAIPEITANGLDLTTATAATYQWYRNGKRVDTATNQSFTASQSGIYVVRTTMNNGCEAMYSYSKGYKITLSEPLDVSISATITTVCAGDTIQLNTTATGGSSISTTYLWSSDPVGFTSTLPDPKAYPQVNTIYKVVATNGIEKDSATVSVTANQIPFTPEISQNENTLTSSVGGGYIWYFNGSLLSGQTSQTLSPTQDGSYQVQIVDVNGCKSPLSAGINFIFTSVPNQISQSDLKVFPNPSNGTFTIESTQLSKGPFSVVIFDALGKRVFKGSNVFNIRLKGFKPGMYQLVTESESGEKNHTVLQLLN